MQATLLIAILTDDVADRAITIAEQQGIRGVTTIPASGISSVPIKTFFGLTFQAAMTILMWIAEENQADQAAKDMHDLLNLDSPKQGLVMTLPIKDLHGLKIPGV